MMEEVRERKDSPKPKASGGSLFSRFKQLDVYTKIDEDYKVQTSWGAFVSLLGWVVIAILVLGEVRNFLTFQVKEHMVVDTTLGQHLRINVNISFHALTCAEVHLDAMDVAGDNQLNIDHNIFKQRLSNGGGLIGQALVHPVGAPKPEPLPADYCGSCFGAETEEIKCCNSCEDLRSAYEKKGWAFTAQLMNSTQCLRERDHPFEAAKSGEGCRVSGTMTVNKVAGNFHIAHGESIVRDGRHIHQFIPAEAPGFNVSHTLHSISFGEPFPNMPRNPLDSNVRIVDPVVGTGLFQYFIRVIPTIYTDEFGVKHHTNQYTTTEKFRPFALPTLPGEPSPGPLVGAVLPGIFFVYELSPFMIEVQRSHMPFSHFFTKLCAIIGGVFTVLGVLDSVVYRFLNLFTRK